MTRTIATLLLLFGCAQDPAPQPVIAIETAHGSEAELQTKAELEGLLDDYDLGRFTFTTRVVVDEDAIPHSHPVLTVHARHLGDSPMLLSTYVHEQLHWGVNTNVPARDAVLAELRRRYPIVPVGGTEGASDEESTRLHLLVCWLELEAMAQLIGRDEARGLMGRWGHYTWIYDRVLHDPELDALHRSHPVLNLDR